MSFAECIVNGTTLCAISAWQATQPSASLLFSLGGIVSGITVIVSGACSCSA